MTGRARCPDRAESLPDRPVSWLSTPLVIALLVHGALAMIFAAIPLHNALTSDPVAPATVRLDLVGMTESGGNPAAGGNGGGPGDASPAQAVAALHPLAPAPTLTPPRSPVTVIGVVDPLAPTTDTHLNIQIGTAPMPGGSGSGFGHGTGSGIGDGTAAGIAGAGGPGQGGYGGLPSGRYNPKPPYPELARLRGWEGTTVLLIEIRPDGQVSLVEVRQSSGHRILDETCIETIRNWKFDPIPATIQVELPIAYRLNEG